jgi:Fic family protein
MKEALASLEAFLHEEGRYSTLIEVGLAHAQFETIHPSRRERQGWQAPKYLLVGSARRAASTRGVVQTAQEATRTAERIFELRERHRKMIIERGLGDNALLLLSELFQRPLVNINLAAEVLDTTYPTASRLVSGLEELEILTEITGRKRSRVYRHEPYVSLFNDPAEPVEKKNEPVEVTDAVAS